LILLALSVTIIPAFAERTIEVRKEIDVKKEILATALTDLRSYKEVFPAFVKDVRVDSNTNQAKFIVIAQGTHEVDVKSSMYEDSFVIDIVSGDLKGSKIITNLESRVGFDGTPNGATIVKTTLILETSWWVTTALALISDSDIRKAVGDGFYELSHYARTKYSQDEPISITQNEKTMFPMLLVTKESELDKEKPTIVFVKPQKSITRNSVFFST
jgi:3-hydroxymyristoyl/3-hydroxydecanoyl-(acyl carrier protein) dehydratase